MKRLFAQAVALAIAAPFLAGCVVATTSGRNGSGGGFLFFLLPLVSFYLIFRFLRGNRGRFRGSQVAHDRQPSQVNESMLRAELSVLAEDVLRLEPQVALHETARSDYESATHRYRVAHAALDQTDQPIDLTRLQRVVDEATWAMARAKAAIDGRTLPEPPPSLQEIGPRGEPALTLDDRQNPQYVGSQATFSSGWFGGAGGMFGGLLFGTMLGGFGSWVDDSNDRVPDDSGNAGDSE